MCWHVYQGRDGTDWITRTLEEYNIRKITGSLPHSAGRDQAAKDGRG